PAFSGFDAVMQQVLSRYGVKGGALAVTKDGHLIYARGYGLAALEAQTPVQADFAVSLGEHGQSHNRRGYRAPWCMTANSTWIRLYGTFSISTFLTMEKGDTAVSVGSPCGRYFITPGGG